MDACVHCGPCLSRPQTLTYVVDPELNEHIRVNNGKIRDVQCIVENGVEVLIGVRTVQLGKYTKHMVFLTATCTAYPCLLDHEIIC